MKMTLREGVDITSLTLQHNILIRATMLLEGREGVLETEKLLRLMLSMIDMIVEEDIIEECNNDERELIDIMMTDIEPFFKALIEDINYKNAWDNMSRILLNRCKEIWDNQHSTVGVMDAILTAIGSMTDEDKKEALTATAKIAEQAFDRRTEEMSNKVDEANTKLENLVNQYQHNVLNKGNDTE